ncbi:MAG: helicase-exonuclease AddAB subunit AddA [Clostridia bacterium]|nr:helicase-exonuclease AddAB subunit AddA [Clostridia bacterium]
MEWTADQREAIEYSGENILLAAAAGSGKTAVLVQRIIELICSPQKRINVNELLVLTFTDAAAREMRQKIAEAIDTALRQNPDDEHLQKQKLMIHSANISTIHSFCLNILKSNIHLTDLPVNFSLISETENKMLLSETLDYVLERFYGILDRDSSVAALAMGYGGIKNDQTLRETVLGLFYFSKSMAYPAKWLNDSIRTYKEIAKTQSLAAGNQHLIIQKIVDDAEGDILDIYNDILDTIKNKLTPDHSYSAFFSDEAASIRRTFDHIRGSDYSAARDLVLNFSFGRMTSGVRGAEGEILAAQEKIKALRDLAKNIMEDLERIFKTEESELIQRIAKTYPVLRTLKNMVLMLDRKYTKRKREKNFLDFNDLEHEALKLLAGKDQTPTDAALRLRNKYKEILIDEYQDTNNIQDTLFKTLSRDNSNIFMVGDLKQSIYTFRNAVPKLFSDKYRDYENTDGCGHLIRLFKNFRSRTQVVNAVNFVFRCIMSSRVGDVNYTEEEYLVNGANYPPCENESDFKTEFHLICSNAPAEENSEPLDKNALEAYVAAKRIRDMIDGKMQVFDKKSSKMRQIQYRDIVVLMRNTKTPAPIFEAVFEESGIPVYTEVGRSYLSSPEVQTVLAFLQIIDNPRQDIPLIAVMRSPIWGFSPESLASMRADMRKGCFLDAVEYAAQNGNNAAAEFLNELAKLRSKAEYTGVERLIRAIYYEYGYYAYSGSMSRGAERQANLRLLFERAAEFEHTRMNGLFSFMNYIETIRSQGDDLTPAKTFGDGEDVVRIMTVHKSKGLEFPVVILADTARDFNMTDLRKNILWNTEAGLAADYVDTKLRVRYPSLPRDLVAMQTRRELMSEEMRLLYVALTRAREKLIVTATFKQTKKGLSLPVFDSKKCARVSYVNSKHSFRDWLMAAFVTHPAAQPVREYFGFGEDIVNTAADFDLETLIYEDETKVPRSNLHEDENRINHEFEQTEYSEELCKKVEYEYPDKWLGNIPVKMSVSEVKRMQTEEADYAPMLEELRTREMARLEKVTGAEKGTVVHFVMQLAQPQDIESAADVKALVESLKADEVITAAQADAVETEKIYAFFASELGRRLKSAKRAEREFSFYTKAPISEIYPDCGEGEILLQGTMDCFFEEADGRLVLLDFKTDRALTKADAAEKAQRYRVQMKYYKKALAEIAGKAADECYLYFLDCGEAVLMNE